MFEPNCLRFSLICIHKSFFIFIWKKCTVPDDCYKREYVFIA